ncbi:MAG: endonuclease/exonuclease/phosphatase family protein [Bacteroidota bacterium]
MSKILKFLFWLIGIVIFIAGLLILIATITDYEPDKVSRIEVSASPEALMQEAEVDLMIWNIGYSGLDASMDFFYDGGEQVRPSKKNVLRNLEAINAFLHENDSLDFFLLQEVDVESKRSYRINQYESISGNLSSYHAYLSLNYKVFFVPLPMKNPMGKVESGLASFSRYQPSEARRYSFPGNYSWPKYLFMLDRCFLVQRHPLTNNKELIIINTHNSAYDDGSLRKIQMEYLREFLIEEYRKGNYIIAGGDWNQSPPGFEEEFDGQVPDTVNYSEISKDYLPEGWKWAYDKTMPTNRRVSTIYERGTTPTALIDFFLVSPNIHIESITGIDMNFQYSDHQPVILKARLTGEQ